MTLGKAREAVQQLLRDYASSRKNDVLRGAETPHLAALLLQKYGYGLCDSFAAIYEGLGPAPTYHDVDILVSEIDPDWKTNADARWASRPADLSTDKR
jgi:hypothetical protein